MFRQWFDDLVELYWSGMATPNPVDSALEAYRAKLVKANTGEVEKK